MKYEQLRLGNQLCFPLYAASREITKRYTPLLNELGLTYTQYIAMMVLWESEEITVKALGERLFLDSGTLSPMINSLVKKNFLQKTRAEGDERQVIISLTEKGTELQHKAAEVPFKIASCINLTKEEAENLYKTLYKILSQKQ